MIEPTEVTAGVARNLFVNATYVSLHTLCTHGSINEDQDHGVLGTTGGGEDN